MKVRKSEAISKEGRWEQVAREFAYYCKECGQRPTLKDSHLYLAQGRCRACGGEAQAVRRHRALAAH